jgi:predicted branched-subunit amino acid permease
MQRRPTPHAGPPHWSFAGFNLGLRLALPVLPGMVAFGLAVGATASRKGLSLIDSMLMNGLVYAGAAQMVVMEMWPQHITATVIATFAFVVATVNARLLLITASLHPWFGALPPRQVYPALHLATDAGWLVAMRYRAEGGSDAGVFLGSSVMLWLVWMAATIVGYALGTLIADPRRYGIDLVMPIFFAAMLVPLWRGRRRALAWGTAGAVALLVQHLLDGWWFIIAGAVAGSVAGGFLDDAE